MHNGNASGGTSRNSSVKNWDTLYTRFMNRQEENAASQQPVEGVLPVVDDTIAAKGKDCFQYAEKYIVTTTRHGVMIIDQHRAHLKILFEECLRDIKRMEVTSQRVLFPETLELDMDQQNALASVSEELNSIGFDLEYEEGNRWSIAAVPTMISRGDAREVVLRILESVKEESPDYGADGNPMADVIQKMALVMARSAAITRGRKLSDTEMDNIVGKLLALPDPSLTPAGKRIFTILDEDRIHSLLS